MSNPYLRNIGLIPFDEYYLKTTPVFGDFINGRPGQYVRVFRLNRSFFLFMKDPQENLTVRERSLFLMLG